MPVCKSNKYTGKDVVLEYAIGCGDVRPTDADFKRMGSMRTKEFTVEWETADATADDSIGALRENLPTFQTLSISGDGTHKVAGAGASDLTELTRHIISPDATGGKPYIWLRMTFPDLTFTAFMILTNFSRSAPYDDVVTYSMEASATSSDFGLIVEDTPDVDADDVTSVTVTPATADMVVGGTEQASAIVAPATAFQNVNFTSSNVAVATVTAQGLIRAVAAGSATITARAVADSTKFGTVAVTVT